MLYFKMFAKLFQGGELFSVVTGQYVSVVHTNIEFQNSIAVKAVNKRISLIFYLMPYAFG